MVGLDRDKFHKPVTFGLFRGLVLVVAEDDMGDRFIAVVPGTAI